MLDRYFGNVCELDLIFNFHKAYHILDELLIAGELQEPSKKAILRVTAAQDALMEGSGDSKVSDSKYEICRDLALAGSRARPRWLAASRPLPPVRSCRAASARDGATGGRQHAVGVAVKAARGLCRRLGAGRASFLPYRVWHVHY